MFTPGYQTPLYPPPPLVPTMGIPIYDHFRENIFHLEYLFEFTL